VRVVMPATCASMYTCNRSITLITVSIDHLIAGARQPPSAGIVIGHEKGLPHGRARLPKHIMACVDSQA